MPSSEVSAGYVYAARRFAPKIGDSQRPATLLVGLRFPSFSGTGCLIGTKRVSLFVNDVRSIGGLNRPSKRNTKISASIVVLPTAAFPLSFVEHRELVVHAMLRAA